MINAIESVMITPEQRVLSLIISICFLYVIIRLVKTGYISIISSAFWIFIGACSLGIVIFYNQVLVVSHYLGVPTPLSFLLILSVLLLFVISLYQTIVITRLQNQIVKLTQEIALEER